MFVSLCKHSVFACSWIVLLWHECCFHYENLHSTMKFQNIFQKQQSLWNLIIGFRRLMWFQVVQQFNCSLQPTINQNYQHHTLSNCWKCIDVSVLQIHFECFSMFYHQSLMNIRSHVPTNVLDSQNSRNSQSKHLGPPVPSEIWTQKLEKSKICQLRTNIYCPCIWTSSF